MSNIGTLPGSRLAGLSADLFHKLQKGVISLDELALFNQRKSPFEFKRNEHGHIMLTIIGLDLTGEQEVKRLEDGGFRMNAGARSCLISEETDGYDKNHRLVAGQSYKITLMPTQEIECVADRTTENLLRLGFGKYGYSKPLAGIAPRIYERISGEEMKKIGIWRIYVPHNPIKDYGNAKSVLCMQKCNNASLLVAYLSNLTGPWGINEAFAFLDTFQ